MWRHFSSGIKTTDEQSEEKAVVQCAAVPPAPEVTGEGPSFSQEAHWEPWLGCTRLFT